MTDYHSDDDDAPIEFFINDDPREMAVEIVELYFNQNELDYINKSIEEILQAYEFFGWEHPPERDQLYRYLVGNAFYIRSNHEVEHCACWRVQIQALDIAPHGFEILLAVGEDIQCD